MTTIYALLSIVTPNVPLTAPNSARPASCCAVSRDSEKSSFEQLESQPTGDHVQTFQTTFSTMAALCCCTLVRALGTTNCQNTVCSPGVGKGGGGTFMAVHRAIRELGKALLARSSPTRQAREMSMEARATQSVSDAPNRPPSITAAMASIGCTRKSFVTLSLSSHPPTLSKKR